MPTYYIDANFFLRFLLKDNLTQLKVVREYFLKAKSRTIKIVCLIEIILETEYVLKKVYKYPRAIISQFLLYILNISYLEFPEREILYEAFKIYQRKSIDLVDLILYFKAKKNNAEVLSFDKDFGHIS
ncbi:hypothetical protein CO005_00945 [Candidatus Roizmanbacteria bacterium CG_4_8_14_3_um_filter_34_9]|uniref:PIN domain-containing protein n=3 Tax=Candidatus Roizmaniibacteriota TaxID=1752723 RepID=A0A2M7AUX9_9BACT|nr:MAG: hypothetical protein COT02_05890 [Candidatus Roizmanbacteria bacterium CG07_land_8_20_14_0_80_34_15]PIU74363.1 MAG: hypothetical protein COS77_01925 [Candidatus Roizmanbacteria bacterium CG06_land_8_20_14_3_00_34_14]PIW73524.1 MAG: hypothetical protein CO005_00945 [Candidatus Roizmanbacteria bacterium CG_4_8_14_3_um_filter_34_9]